jgi:hypothetical protein
MRAGAELAMPSGNDPDRAMELDAPAKAAVRELSLHWCANPFACDTAEGIARWWIRASTGVTVDNVTAALMWMKRRGLVEELQAADGRVRFRRASGDVEARLARLAEGRDAADDSNEALH